MGRCLLRERSFLPLRFAVLAFKKAAKEKTRQTRQTWQNTLRIPRVTEIAGTAAERGRFSF